MEVQQPKKTEEETLFQGTDKDVSCAHGLSTDPCVSGAQLGPEVLEGNGRSWDWSMTSHLKKQFYQFIFSSDHLFCFKCIFIYLFILNLDVLILFFFFFFNIFIGV